MSMKMGNCSRDTMADRAITSPKSFPKCSEGKLGRDKGVPVSFRVPPPSRGLASVGLCQPLAPDSPVLGLPSPTHPHEAFPPCRGSAFQTTEHREGIVPGPGKPAGTQTQAVPQGGLKERTDTSTDHSMPDDASAEEARLGWVPKAQRKKLSILGELEQRALQGE